MLMQKRLLTIKPTALSLKVGVIVESEMIEAENFIVRTPFARVLPVMATIVQTAAKIMNAKIVSRSHTKERTLFIIQIQSRAT